MTADNIKCSMQMNIWKIIYWTVVEHEAIIDHCSYVHNLSSSEIKTWKKFRPEQDSNQSGTVLYQLSYQECSYSLVLNMLSIYCTMEYACQREGNSLYYSNQVPRCPYIHRMGSKWKNESTDSAPHKTSSYASGKASQQALFKVLEMD